MLPKLTEALNSLDSEATGSRTSLADMSFTEAGSRPTLSMDARLFCLHLSTNEAKSRSSRSLSEVSLIERPTAWPKLRSNCGVYYF